MTREQVLMGLGVLVLIAPWSGLPLAWLTWILLAIGIGVVAIGFTLVQRSKPDDKKEPPLQLQAEDTTTHIAFS